MAKTRRERPLKKFPQILVGFLLLIYALFFAWRAWASVTYPFPIEYGEGAVLDEVSHLAHGVTLYTANLAPPYRAVVYGPLYYWLNAAPLAFIVDPTFAFGRLLSVLATVGACFCVFWVRRKYVGVWVALAAALTPLATEPVFAWGTLFKPDMLATALSLTAVTIIFTFDTKSITFQQPVSADKPPDRRFKRKAEFADRMLYLAALLCILAFFIKQSAFAAPIAIFLSLLSSAPNRALRFGLTSIAGGVGLLIFFQIVTQGQFLPHFISYNGQPYDFGVLLASVRYLLQTFPVLLLLSLIWLWQGTDKEGLWKIYWVVALLVTFSVGKVGSNLNYYLELVFVSTLLSWWQVAQWWQERPALNLGRVKLPLAATGFLLMALQLVIWHHIPVVADGANTPGPVMTAQARQIATALQQYAIRGPLLVEDAGWLPPIYLESDLDDSFVFGQLAQGGQWQQDRFLQALASGHYQTVMLQMAGVAGLNEAELESLVTSNQYQVISGRFSPQMLDIFHKQFRPDKRIGTTLFLVWKL